MKKILIGAALIALIIVMVMIGVMRNEEGGLSLGSGPSQPVEVTMAKTGDLSSSILVTGSVKEVNKKEVVAENALKISSTNVEVGDKVKAGDTLYTVDISSLEDELVQLRINREVSALQLEKIQEVSTTSSATGAKISVELSKLSLASAENLYNTQLENLEKNKTLFDEGIISESEYTALQQGVDDAFSQIDVAKLNLESSQANLNQIYNSNYISGQSLEYDVEIQLKNLELMDLNIAKLEKQIVDAADATKAPINGVITAKYIETGDVTMVNSPVYQIIDMDELEVIANVREYDIRDMEVGQTVVFSGDALGDDMEVTGLVSYIAPVASTVISSGRESTAIEIKMTIEKGNDYLKPGFTLDCDITTEELTDVVIGDFNMFTEDKDDNKIAFVVVDGVLEERQVETGVSSDFETEIISGISEGELVVLNPSFAHKDGMAVEITNDYEKAEEEVE